MEEGFDDSDSAANKVLPTSRRQCRSLCRQDAGSTLRFMEPTTLMPCIGTMNCPADVAQASSPASSPGVSPGVRAGGETPPQLAAGTAALRGSWKQLAEVRQSSLGRFFPDRLEIAFFAAAHETFGDRLQLFPACADGFSFLPGDMIVCRGGCNDRQQVGEFLNDLVGGGHEMNRMRPGRLGISDEEPAGPFTNPVHNAGVVGAADQRFDAVQRIGRAAASAIVRLGPFVDHRERQAELSGDLFGAAFLENFLEHFMRFHAPTLARTCGRTEAPN